MPDRNTSKTHGLRGQWSTPGRDARSRFDSKKPPNSSTDWVRGAVAKKMNSASSDQTPHPTRYIPDFEKGDTVETLFKNEFGLEGENSLMESLHTDGGMLCGVIRSSEDQPVFPAYSEINRYIMISALNPILHFDPQWYRAEKEKYKNAFLEILEKHGTGSLFDRIQNMDRELAKRESDPEKARQAWRLGENAKFIDNEDIMRLARNMALTWLGNIKMNRRSLPDTEIPKNDVQ